MKYPFTQEDCINFFRLLRENTTNFNVYSKEGRKKWDELDIIAEEFEDIKKRYYDLGYDGTEFLLIQIEKYISILKKTAWHDKKIESIRERAKFKGFNKDLIKRLDTDYYKES